MRLNCRAAAVLAESCRGNGSYYIQISTDHYYKGDGMPRKMIKYICLTNTRVPNMLREAFALTYEQTLVVRTNIVGFRGIPSQPTFVEWVLQSLQNRLPIKLFSDFYAPALM